MLDLNPQLKKQLKDAGRTEYGRTFLAALEEAKKHYSSINTIDTKRDATAQIEGRQLMCEMIDELTGMIVNKKRDRHPGDLDNFE